MKNSLTILLLCIGLSASATHLVGGNMAYEYLGDTDGDGNYNYKITFQTFLDCNSPFWQNGFPESVLDIGIYRGSATPTGNLFRLGIFILPLIDSNSIVPAPTNGCSVGQTVCLYQATYETEVDLPFSLEGYHLFYDRCCRTPSVINLSNPGNQGLAFHAYIPPTLVNNSSPVFSDDPVPFLCVGDTTSILNTATDPDGDLLLFSFVNPYKGFGDATAPAPPLPSPLPWPIPNVDWVNTSYNENNPFGAAGYAFIDGTTGLSKYMAPSLGNYVLAVEIREFRFGNLIGITRRDMQFVAFSCPSNPPPNLSATGGSGTTSYTIQECDNLTFPVHFIDPDGDSLQLMNTGTIFDTAVVNPAATISPLVVGDSTVSTTFNWQTGCGSAQALPYFFTASAKDNGCPAKTTNVVYEITVNPPTVPTFLTQPPVVCENTTASYTVNAINGYTFNWTVTGGTILSGQGSTAINVAWGTAGSGTVTVEAANSCGCPSTAVNTAVTILSAPTADAGADLVICEGDSIQIGGIPTGNAGTATTWTPNIHIQDSSMGNPFVFPNSTTSYTVVVDNGACQTTDTMLVNVLPAPTADAGLDQSICDSGSVILGGNPTGPLGVTYSWTPSGTLNNDTVANPSATLSTTTNYTVVVTGSNGCSIADTVLITVNPLLVPSFSIDTSMCTGAVFNPLPTTSNNGVSGSWSPAPNNTTTTTYTFTPNAGSCASNATVTVAVHTIIIPTFNAVNPICIGNSLAPLPTTSLNGIAGTWSPALDQTATTTYTFVPTTIGCFDSTTTTITVHPLPIIDAGIDTAICQGSSAQLNATGGVSYLWYPPTTISNPNIPNPMVSPVATTAYIVVGTDNNMCSNSDTVVVDVFSIATLKDTFVCIGSALQLHVDALPGATYSWTPTSNLSDPTIANPTTNTTTTITYHVTVQNADGCLGQTSVLVTTEPQPTIAFLMDAAPSCDGVLVKFTNLSTNADSYLWTYGDGNQSTLVNPTHTFTTTENVTTTLQGLSDKGCSNHSDSMINTLQLGEMPELIPPSVFSPNNDGVNDVFQLDVPPSMAACTQLQVFNRWGLKIFESDGENIAWDGKTVGAKEVPEGTYFYTVEMNGVLKKGTLTLMR